MSYFTYTGNVDPSEKTGAVSLRGGALILRVNEYADLTAQEVASVSSRIVLTPGIVPGAAAAGTGVANDFGNAFDGQELAVIGGRLKPLIRYGQIEVSGHSLPVGIAASAAAAQPPSANHVYPRRMAAALDVPVFMRAVGGSYAARAETTIAGQGGYAHNSRLVRRDVRTAAPWLPESSLAILHTGINDYTGMGGETRPLVHAMRRIIDEFRQSRRFEDTDGSIASSGTWGNQANTAGVIFASGDGASFTATNGSAKTITVPSGHSGAISIGFVAFNRNNGGVFTIAVDGVTHGTIDLRNSAVATDPLATPSPGISNGATYRITGLTAGQHTVTVTYGSNAGPGGIGSGFDYWAMTADPLPVVLVPLQHKCGSNPLTINSYSFTESDRTAMNNAIRALCSEFTDGMVIPVDLDSGPFGINGDSSCLADGLHLNEKGQVKVAQTMLAAALTAPVDMTLQEPYLRLVQLPRAYVIESWAWANSWSPFDAAQSNNPPTLLPAFFKDPRNGMVYAEGGAARAGNPVTDETMFNFPPGFKSFAAQRHPAAATGIGFVNTKPDGSLTYQSGTGAYVDLAAVRFRAAIP
jgi:hypothetical protein